MKSITEVLTEHSDRARFKEYLELGWCGDRDAIRSSWPVADEVQRATGLGGGIRNMLSKPEWQHKLGMGSIPSFGLSLFHHVSKTHQGLTVNACPSAGDCIRLCVLNNSNGQYETTQKSWRWRTNMLVHHPLEFFVILGHNMAKACDVDGNRPQRILMRLNVNSDVEWHKFIPEMFDASVFGEWVKFYDYTKHHKILTDHPTGWVGEMYRVAYSWNESSAVHAEAVKASFDAGGSLAVVTDRLNRDREPFNPVKILSELRFLPGFATVLDADKGDEWMFTESSIGDLSFKPRTKELRDWGVHSDFVVKCYGHSHQASLLS